jgi:hypothetical protein
MGKNFSPNPVIIVPKAVTDGLGVLEDVFLTHFH